MPDEVDEIGAPPILPRRHDRTCEISKPKSHLGPPAGTCWCDARAEGYVAWVVDWGAATITFDADSPGPPNIGGAA